MTFCISYIGYIWMEPLEDDANTCQMLRLLILFGWWMGCAYVVLQTIPHCRMQGQKIEGHFPHGMNFLAHLFLHVANFFCVLCIVLATFTSKNQEVGATSQLHITITQPHMYTLQDILLDLPYTKSSYIASWVSFNLTQSASKASPSMSLVPTNRPTSFKQKIIGLNSKLASAINYIQYRFSKLTKIRNLCARASHAGTT